MAETDISFKVDLQGGEQTAAGLDKVTKALDDNADKQKKAADASVLHGTGVEKLSATMGLLGGAIGSVNPGLGSFVSTIGQSIGAVTQLEVAMGPLGIAIGVASAALALYTRSQADAKQATDAATQSLDAYISKIQQAARETERLGRLSTGAGTQLEYQARVEQLSAERSSAQDVLNPFSRSGFTATAADRENARQRIADLDRQISETQRLAGQAQDLVDTVSAHDEGDVRFNGRRGTEITPRGTRQQRPRRGGSNRFANARVGDLGTLGPGDADRAGLGALAEGAGSAVDLDQFLAGERSEDFGAAEDAKELAAQRGRYQSEQAIRAFQKQAHQQRLAEIAAEAAAWSQYGQTAMQAVSTIADIAASSTKNELEASKIRAYGQGVNEGINAAVDLATAIGSTVENPALAATKYISAAAHTANAVKAFAFSGKSGDTGSGGGGGGSGAPRPSAPDARAGSGGGGLTIVLSGPIIGAGQMADAGREINRAIQAADDRYPGSFHR